MPERSAATTALALACTANFLVLFDVSVMTVALPSIQADLGFTPTGLQWVVSAYALAFAGLLLLGGRLADLYGHRRVFVGGLAVFTAASLTGGLAGTPATLIAARAAQGTGAAVLAPLALTMVTTGFPEGPPRTRALTVWTAVSLVGGACGNMLGGVLTQYLSWRSVLLVNVPVGLPILLFARRVLARPAVPRRRVRLDLPGAVLATAASTLLTLGVAEADSHAWSAPGTALPLLGGVLALAAFVVVETRFAAAPLIPPRLFGLPGIGWGNLAMLLAGASQVPLWYFLTLTMQDVLHYSAAQTGLGFVPHAVVMLLVGLRLIPWLMRRVQARVLIAAGALIAALGFWWQSAVTPDSDYVTGILGPAVAISFGGGLVSTPLTTTVTSGVRSADAGAASGLMNTTRQFGGAFGLAMVVTLTASDTGGTPAALAAGYRAAFQAIAMILVLLAVLTPVLPTLRDSRYVPRS
ncbi:MULTISPECIES: MFS transporter [Streptomycetaceae]|uniref:Cephamycin export protein n=1 Tax=Streptantibioticus cattleyicolor (strain ATCC 35852 / DSM 46488 / JCM 4925 / NBRC 14057 / NRRL 8057) TaxID=1003195 RepID=F8JTX0_STREN|nr:MULTISPECIES: MFS transporter [Streptomycetaceae]AEW98060.1 cephamycin export protein [Streptantibioticus cattleyicolor NRRL 8057 = DSM 46488]MYS62454.1 MFS transporter [Streptomyces sp. SID5468]CCB78376.1 putative Cephamycin export protein [Streptantibioticus cattleyicolor NRRL 8057 = DSM 46488]